jgi:zinc transporter 1
MILLQSTPNDMDVRSIKERLLKLEGVVSIHDFHIWQLIDGMIISSIHVGVEDGAEFITIINDMKRILHDFGIHSTSIQPEYVPRSKVLFFFHTISNRQPVDYCEQNCVRECDEDWCCKKPAEKRKQLLDEYSTATDV